MWPLYNKGPKVWQGIGYNEVSLYWGSFSLLLLLPRQRMLLVIPRTLHIEVCYIGATVIMFIVFFAHKCLKQDSYFYIYRLEEGLKFISVCLEQVHGKIEGSALHSPSPPPPLQGQCQILASWKSNCIGTFRKIKKTWEKNTTEKHRPKRL